MIFFFRPSRCASTGAAILFLGILSCPFLFRAATALRLHDLFFVAFAVGPLIGGNLFPVGLVVGPLLGGELLPVGFVVGPMLGGNLFPVGFVVRPLIGGSLGFRPYLLFHSSIAIYGFSCNSVVLKFGQVIFIQHTLQWLLYAGFPSVGVCPHSGQTYIRDLI